MSIRQIDLLSNKLKVFNFKSFFKDIYNQKNFNFENKSEYEVFFFRERTLDLRENDIVSSFHLKDLDMHFETFNITKHWKINLYLDKINCFCQIFDLYSFITGKKFKNLQFIEIDFIKCKEPMDKYLHEYEVEDFKSMIHPSECPGKCVENEKKADCSNRGLTEFPKINGLNIKELDLRNNNLTYLDSKFLESIHRFNIPTYLSGNNWKCDCENLTFLDIVSKTPEIRDEVSCSASDKYIISSKFSHQKMRDICTESSTKSSNIGFIVCLIFLLTLLVIIFFKKEIRIWLFAHKMFLCWISEDEIDKNRIYDAFICYSERDEHYVQQIVEELESGPNPYKLCLHFRDWLVGEYISKQIVTSVEQSKRTIFIITNNFLDSMWSRLEFRSACAASIREKVPRIIEVLCQEIEDLGKLDSEIKAYFNSNTYLKWNDTLFWSKLRYALPHRTSKVSNNIEMAELKTS